MSDHPYAELEDSALWKRVAKALHDLQGNGDLQLHTNDAYVIGYICKALAEECRACLAEVPTTGPKICSECGHVFRGNGWDGIDAHWRAKHETIVPYEQFWSTMCADHRGRPAGR